MGIQIIQYSATWKLSRDSGELTGCVADRGYPRERLNTVNLQAPYVGPLVDG